MRLYNFMTAIGKDIFIESREQQYAQMFPEDPVYTTDEDRTRWSNTVSMAKRVFKRDDRIVWLLRRHQAATVMRYISRHGEYTGKANDPEIQHLYDKFNKLMKKIGHSVKYSYMSNYEFDSLLVQLNSSREREFEHFLSLPIPAIQNFVFTNQSIHEIIQYFRELEAEWKENRKGAVDADSDDEAEIILEFPDGLAWWKLDRSDCRDEADAMGHCGNAGGEGQILSLRTPVNIEGQRWWRPHLTFILHEDGFLGEMKGRGNKKPTQKYHPYIVELLKMDIISGIRGGGYLPEENFHLSDLSPEVKETLLREKPELGDFQHIANTKGLDVAVSLANKLFSEVDLFVHELPENLLEYIPSQTKQGHSYVLLSESASLMFDYQYDAYEFAKEFLGSSARYMSRLLAEDDVNDDWVWNNSYAISDEVWDHLPDSDKEGIRDYLIQEVETENRHNIDPEYYEGYDLTDLKTGENTLLDFILNYGKHDIAEEVLEALNRTATTSYQWGALREIEDILKRHTESWSSGSMPCRAVWISRDEIYLVTTLDKLNQFEITQDDNGWDSMKLTIGYDDIDSRASYDGFDNESVPRIFSDHREFKYPSERNK